jgi:hypothetical protein
MLFKWHKVLMSGDEQVQDIGGYRTHPEPMQVVALCRKGRRQLCGASQQNVKGDGCVHHLIQ